MTAPIDRFPSRSVLLLRGVTRRCAWCGDRKGVFLSWFRRQEHCRHCGHGYRRGDNAFELGANTANLIMTFGLILTTMAVMIGVTAPDVPILLTVGTVGAIALVGPLALYPISYTVWQAVDLLMRGPTDDELAGLADASL